MPQALQALIMLGYPPPPHYNTPTCRESISTPSSHYDVFRCNQFYFEEEYYLGREVKYAFANPSVLFEQSYTYRTLHYKNEYKIHNIVCSEFNLKHMDLNFFEHREIFSDIIAGSSVLQNIQEFFTFMRHNEIYHEKRITSGIYMCAFAVALGYKEIYIAGIDLYSSNGGYVFHTLKPNLATLMPDFTLTPAYFHTPQTDIEALEFLAQTYNVRFYSLCPNSPLSQYIPLAEIRGKQHIKEAKAKDSIKDFLLPQESAYCKFHYPNQPHSKIDAINDKYIAPLRNNHIYRFYKDFTKLPRQIIKYYKGKIILHKHKRNIATNTKNARNVAANNGGGGANMPIIPLLNYEDTLYAALVCFYALSLSQVCKAEYTKKAFIAYSYLMVLEACHATR